MTFAERQLKVQRINQNSDKENLDNDIEDNKPLVLEKDVA